jgi:hypothetical protein
MQQRDLTARCRAFAVCRRDAISLPFRHARRAPFDYAAIFAIPFIICFVSIF